MLYQAYALVIAPEYKYRNPVTGALHSDPAECRRLAQEYAAVTWPANEFRRARFMAELTIDPAPPHIQAKDRVEHAFTLRSVQLRA